MNRIKEILGNITKKAWIIGSIGIVVLLTLVFTVWPFSIFDFKRDLVSKTDTQTEQFVEQATQQIFTKDNVANGEYKNDVQGATTYVQNTEEVKVAVVIDKDAQKIVPDSKKISCGYITFVTTRVATPAVLTNSLKALFENKVSADFEPGNIIPTSHPDLTLQKVMIDSGVAKVYLGGNFNGEKDGWCGASLAIAQIVETAKTFPNVTNVEVYQGDKKVY